MSAVRMRRALRVAAAAPALAVLMVVAVVFGVAGTFVVLLLAPLIAVGHPTFSAIKSVATNIAAIERWAFWDSECAACEARRKAELESRSKPTRVDVVKADVEEGEVAS